MPLSTRKYLLNSLKQLLEPQIGKSNCTKYFLFSHSCFTNPKIFYFWWCKSGKITIYKILQHFRWERILRKYNSPLFHIAFFIPGLASRILQVGPRGSKFLGPVLIEVPHVASLRDGDREVVVLRCDSASKGNWTEHVQEQLDDKTLKVRRRKNWVKKHL